MGGAPATSHPNTDSNVDRNDCCSMLQLFPEWLRTLDISLLRVITRKILDLFDEFTTKEKEANGNKITFDHVFLYIYVYLLYVLPAPGVKTKHLYLFCSVLV